LPALFCARTVTGGKVRNKEKKKGGKKTYVGKKRKTRTKEQKKGTRRADGQ
jgi:hypothetical protein